jgi:hypothetical protein
VSLKNKNKVSGKETLTEKIRLQESYSRPGSASKTVIKENRSLKWYLVGNLERKLHEGKKKVTFLPLRLNLAGFKSAF